ncbi:MAG: hypothetical protein R2827_02885 [Bdellovibrionales bacterium]
MARSFTQNEFLRSKILAAVDLPAESNIEIENPFRFSGQRLYFDHPDLGRFYVGFYPLKEGQFLGSQFVPHSELNERMKREGRQVELMDYGVEMNQKISDISFDLLKVLEDIASHEKVEILKIKTNAMKAPRCRFSFKFYLQIAWGAPKALFSSLSNSTIDCPTTPKTLIKCRRSNLNSSLNLSEKSPALFNKGICDRASIDRNPISQREGIRAFSKV